MQPTRLPCPWDSPGKNTGVGCHFLLQCLKVKSESEVAQLCPTLSDSMDCSLPGSSVYVTFRQEYWSGLSSPSPGDLPKPEIEPISPALAGRFFITAFMSSFLREWGQRQDHASRFWGGPPLRQWPGLVTDWGRGQGCVW